MKKFLGRLLLFLIVAAGAGYLLFPVVSDQYAQYQNAPRIRYYRQRAASLAPATEAETTEKSKAWNLDQLLESIPTAENADAPPGGAEEEQDEEPTEEDHPPAETPAGKNPWSSLMATEEGITPDRVAQLITLYSQADEPIGDLIVQDPFSAEDTGAVSLLYADGNGVIGILEIPKIGLTLPVYRSNSQKNSETGLFYGPGSSLPVGGAGSHALLAGSGGQMAPGALADIGLTGAKVLKDMDRLAAGDLFIFTVMNQTLVYQVDQVSAGPAADTIALERNRSDERMTLVSATLDGGRMTVRGKRLNPDSSGDVLERENAAFMPPDWVNILAIGSPVMAFGLLVMFIVERVKRRRYRLPNEK
ncbi:MAG: sortase [Clostridia bacterium]|nr:sortase [Clostridia bacterium]